MNTRKRPCPALLALAAMIACPLAADAVNLLVNGSFEAPDFPNAALISGAELLTVPGWSGLAYVFDGGGGAYSPSWPAAGASGAQYGDFGNGPDFKIKQDFVVPVGGNLIRLTWWDSSSFVFGGGSYTVRLLSLPSETTVAEIIVNLPAAAGSALPWTPRALPLPPSAPPPGNYRLVFIGSGMIGTDYLVDDVIAEAGPAESTLFPAGGGNAPAQFLGPGSTAYTRFQDSPFSGPAFTYFHLENWEDHALNTPGVQVEASGYSLSSGFGPGLIDSVDADDGLVNGASNNGAGQYGEAVWSAGSFLFTFDATVLGALPTHAGIVWTDGGGPVRFEAFDASGVSLGATKGTSSDAAITGETDEDRFYGVTYGGGISAIRIWSPVGSAMEVDHLQYGRGPALPGGAPQAYATNAGWINARPSAEDGVRVHGSYLSGWAHAANLGWIFFGGGTLDSRTYSNSSAYETGVNRDPAGNLAGYAYGANIGWINFGWAAPDDPQRARTDLTTGRFLGYAYSANIGWIDLAAAGLAHDVVAFPDTDLDGLPDAWEAAQFGNLADAGAATDYDGDGFTDLVEYQTGSHPRDLDSPAPASPSTLSGVAKDLYAANAGWIDARPSARFGLRVGEYFLAGWLSAPNFGWIHVGDGSPANGHAYANSSADDYGVNIDAGGALSGQAYAPNIGWINFGWAGLNDPNRPRVDPATGVFNGYVYAANLGWITFDYSELRTTRIDRPDTDADSISDAWERENFGDLSSAAVGTDADKDGQSDAAEYLADTDPRNPADYFRIISHQIANELTYVTLEFTSSEARRYRIEYTSQLAGGAWIDSPLGVFSPDAGVITTRSFVLAEPATARFFRAVAIPTLTP